MANFRVGQKVVCIKGHGKALEEGAIYTVEEVIFQYGNTYIAPEECRADFMGCKGWLASRFRPLISQADDVEMFLRISEDSLGRLVAYEELLNEQFYVDESHG